MFKVTRKPVLHAALSMVLLLMGAANLFTLSIDDDGDEATPPIKVELNFVASNRKGIQTQAARERARHQGQAEPVRELGNHAKINIVIAGPSLTSDNASPQLVTPLRT
jgi:hypothetical protein